MELSWTVLMVWFFFKVLPGKCNSFEYESVPNQYQDNEEDRDENGASSTNNNERDADEDAEYQAEKEAGNMADLSGSNPQWSYPTVYKDFGRRFVLQYPYTEKQQPKETKKSSENRQLIPVKATPEEVLAVAVKSAIYAASKPYNRTDDSIRKDILRTGQFWNSVWVEEVDPQAMLRSETLETFQDNVKGLGSVKAKVMPGSNLYQLVSVLKQFSPRLLYVINNKE